MSLNVQEVLTELLATDARMAALKAHREELRSTLDAEARKRWVEDGAVPSWKVARLGSATLAGTESTTANVVDPDAYASWARGSRTESVTLEVTVPAVAVDDHTEALAALEGADGVQSAWRVHPGVLNGLVAEGRIDVDSGALWSGDGEVVPGVRVSLKDPYLSVRLVPEAKRRALAELAGDSQPEQVVPVANASVVSPGQAERRASVGATGGVSEVVPPPQPSTYVDPF